MNWFESTFICKHDFVNMMIIAVLAGVGIVVGMYALIRGIGAYNASRHPEEVAEQIDVEA